MNNRKNVLTGKYGLGMKDPTDSIQHVFVSLAVFHVTVPDDDPSIPEYVNLLEAVHVDHLIRIEVSGREFPDFADRCFTRVITGNHLPEILRPRQQV